MQIFKKLIELAQQTYQKIFISEEITVKNLIQIILVQFNEPSKKTRLEVVWLNSALSIHETGTFIEKIPLNF